MSGSANLQGMVLAAGAGQRFGGGKLLALYQDQPLIHWAVLHALETPIQACLVVTAPDDAAVREAAQRATGDDARLVLVVAHDARAGLSASLKAGVRALPGDSSGVLIFLGDMPDVDPSHGVAIAETLTGGASCVEMVCQGQPAHPVGFAASLYPDLLALQGDAGARRLLDRPDAVRLQTDDVGTVLDIDTPDDLDRLNHGSVGGRS